jgi:hypothetical protein
MIARNRLTGPSLAHTSMTMGQNVNERSNSSSNKAPSSNEEHEGQISLWKLYRNFVRRNSVSLHLLDNTLSQLIFWTPQNASHDESTTSRWREVLYGLLSLHQMAADMAGQDEEIPESYGATVEIKPITTGISPTTIRVAITVVHNLLPTILQLVRHKHSRARIRLVLEQIKFLLRIILAGSYWYQLHSQHESLDSCGLIVDGGMYHGDSTMGGGATGTVEQVQAWRGRQSYVGRRTGRKVTTTTKDARQAAELDPSSKIVSSRLVWGKKRYIWPLIVGECLHISRPLIWAAIEARGSAHRPSLKDWTTILGIDVASLLLLNQHRQFPHGNSQELKRRKMKLFLYLLRSPFFERFTGPVVSRAGTLSRAIPLIGSLIETYLWDWLLYWKHPYAAEYD